MKSSLQAWLYKNLSRFYDFYVQVAMGASSRLNLGTNVFERDWDVLIILDTCRVDALQEISSEYMFLPDNIGSIWSVGSTSNEWISNTFNTNFLNEIQNTAYISANSHAKHVIEDRYTPEEDRGVKANFSDWSVVQKSDFLYLEQVWQYNPSNTPGHIDPKFVTDRAIRIKDKYSPDRLIIHYSHPHAPYTSEAIDEGRDLYPYEESPFDYLINGGNKNKVWSSYIANIRYVLDSVSILLDNMSAKKVVISSDHGEAFGEWELYSHQAGYPTPEVRRVPWVETTASNNGNYEPTWEPPKEKSQTVEEQLEALGYK